jgi:hypothetical protein
VKLTVKSRKWDHSHASTQWQVLFTSKSDSHFVVFTSNYRVFHVEDRLLLEFDPVFKFEIFIRFKFVGDLFRGAFDVDPNELCVIHCDDTVVHIYRLDPFHEQLCFARKHINIFAKLKHFVMV